MRFIGRIQIGGLTLVPPEGARGRRVILSLNAAAAAIPTLVGKPLRILHKGQAGNSVIGRITEANIDDKWLMFSAELDRGIPEFAKGYGLSWEIEVAYIENPALTRVWKVYRIGAFGGIALVDRPAAREQEWKVEGEWTYKESLIGLARRVVGHWRKKKEPR